MTKDFTNIARLYKALSAPNRLMILDMLIGGELCACELLLKLNITQPTLSHHMDILSECGLVNWRKSGKWTYYSLNKETFGELRVFLDSIATEDDMDSLVVCERQY
ncbi:MAG: metalloregulator ArsR/SmtB family transcription factor [Coriobacteriia bacterium]|nr:metalloregulator ArsR/SmtB family transcription factor [Coriobacteriia bacterium]